ncbi:MAG: hypothetical protein JXA62_07280, partial [Candidatus Aminicenantes bacterium]|nr:hypothetical protein [Candidatus Aminicenantes bacterium]
MTSGGCRRMRRRRYLFLLLTALLLLAAYLAIPLPRFPSHYSTVVRDHQGRLLRAFLSPDHQWR